MHYVIFCYAMKHTMHAWKGYFTRMTNDTQVEQLSAPSPAPPLVVLPPLSPGGEMAQCSEDCGWLISLLVIQKHHLQHDTRKELCR